MGSLVTPLPIPSDLAFVSLLLDLQLVAMDTGSPDALLADSPCSTKKIFPQNQPAPTANPPIRSPLMPLALSDLSPITARACELRGLAEPTFFGPTRVVTSMRAHSPQGLNRSTKKLTESPSKPSIRHRP